MNDSLDLEQSSAEGLDHLHEAQPLLCLTLHPFLDAPEEGQDLIDILPFLGAPSIIVVLWIPHVVLLSPVPDAY
ncbi:hypothetical protein [Geminicoccus flavidas]|uniref:hypothetical protein n=1 Tax=Geminicoccus flavidas TaxID=2506407 RepID=UPI0013580B8B|nr:hypothetical protein [Geminicoccus flavidas]